MLKCICRRFDDALLQAWKTKRSSRDVGDKVRQKREPLKKAHFPSRLFPEHGLLALIFKLV